MFKKTRAVKTILKLVVFFGACFFISQISAGHALAAPPCNAGGTWVQADVWVKVVDYQGNLQYWSDNFSFNITALVPKDSAGAPYLQNGDAFDNAQGQNIQTGDYWKTSSLDFNSAGHTHSCFGSPAYDFTDGSNGNILLNCLNANHDANGGAGFAFTPKSVNDSGAAGGSFTKFETFSAAPSNQNGNVAYYFPSWSGVYGTGGFSDLNYANLITVIWTYQLPRPPVNIQGAVYSPSGAALDAVNISGTNVPGGVTTGSPHPGWFSFNETIGNWFSIHAQDPFIGTNGHKYSAVKITPYIGGVDRSAGATSCSFNGTNYRGPASFSGYEWQNANSPNSGTAQCNYGLSTNGGYDFHYTKEQYAHLTASTSVTPTAALYTTQQATFTTTIASTNTLPDDGNDTYTYTVSSYNLVGTNHNSFPTSDSGTCSATASPKLYPDNSHTVTCTITVPSSVPSGSKLCMEVALTSNASYATKSITGSPACVSVITPPTFAINAPTDYELYSDVTSPTTNPSSEVTSIKVGYTVTCNGYRGTLNLTVAADQKFASHTTTVTCSGGTNPTGSWEIFPSPAGTIDTYGVGDYTFTGTIAGGTPSGVSALPPSLLPIQATPATFTIYTVPYARFYGNDIYSGGTVTFNTKDSTSTGAYGSASQYAVLAHGLISMASNALSSTTTSPTGPGNLSAANFGATQPLVGLPSTGTTPIDWNASGYYGDTSSDQTLSGTTGVTQKVTIIGKDIFINGNITVTPPTGTFNDSTTPVVLIIAQGDVYIHSNVTQLDAIIEATGNIYTCSPNTAAKTHDESCTSPLLVNGVLGAGSQIHFDRSFGTRLTAGDASTNAGSYMHYSDLTQFGYNGAAEVINFPAYLYFASSYISSATSQGTKPDSLVNVAPLL